MCDMWSHAFTVFRNAPLAGFKWLVEMLHKIHNFVHCDLKCWLMSEKWIKITFKLNVFSVVLCIFVTFSVPLNGPPPPPPTNTLCFNIWDQKVQNSLFYEAFLPITWIKPRAGIVKYRKRLRQHVLCDIMMPQTVWMVRLCSAVAASCFFSLVWYLYVYYCNLLNLSVAGPCPPCPKTVRVSCHCAAHPPVVRRCSAKLWSCGKPCGKRLFCGQHNCETPCHSGMYSF